MVHDAARTPSGSRCVTLLVAINLALGAFLYWLATVDIASLMPAPEVVAINAGTDSERRDQRELRQPPELASLGETLRRPLFRADRRPYAAPPPAPPVVTAPAPVAAATPARPPEPKRSPPKARLAGIVEIGGKMRALLRSPSEPNGTWLLAGEHIEGWQVERIGRSEIELSAGKQRLVMPLEAPRRETQSRPQ